MNKTEIVDIWLKLVGRGVLLQLDSPSHHNRKKRWA